MQRRSSLLIATFAVLGVFLFTGCKGEMTRQSVAEDLTSKINEATDILKSAVDESSAVAAEKKLTALTAQVKAIVTEARQKTKDKTLKGVGEKLPDKTATALQEARAAMDAQFRRILQDVKLWGQLQMAVHSFNDATEF
jgi:hypothetical protein